MSSFGYHGVANPPQNSSHIYGRIYFYSMLDQRLKCAHSGGRGCRRPWLSTVTHRSVSCGTFFFSKCNQWISVFISRVIISSILVLYSGLVANYYVIPRVLELPVVFPKASICITKTTISEMCPHSPFIVQLCTLLYCLHWPPHIIFETHSSTSGYFQF